MPWDGRAQSTADAAKRDTLYPAATSASASVRIAKWLATKINADFSSAMVIVLTGAIGPMEGRPWPPWVSLTSLFGGDLVLGRCLQCFLHQVDDQSRIAVTLFRAERAERHCDDLVTDTQIPAHTYDRGDFLAV